MSDPVEATQAVAFEHRAATHLKQSETRIINNLVSRARSKDGLDPQEAVTQIHVISELRKFTNQLHRETIKEIEEVENG